MALIDWSNYVSDDDRSNVPGEVTQGNITPEQEWRRRQYTTKPPPQQEVNPINGQPWDPNPPPPPSNYNPDGSGEAGGGGGGKPPPMDNSFTGPIWQPIGYEQDPMDFDTRAPYPGAVPEFDWYTGDGGPNNVTQWQQNEGNTFTFLNPDGSVTPGVVDPTTRDVMPEELVENRLSNLLRSDSKLIQDARRQGMEQSNALGGLGGTVGAGASMQAAMRTALPIAQSDAEAYRAAASQNMDALNQFAQLNHQRATQLEATQIDARTRLQTTQITTSAQMAAAMLESATQRDLSMLDSETKLRLQEMQGKIQDRLATNEFKYSALLNDAQYAAELAKTMMQGEYGLAGTGLAGQWDKAIQDQANQVQQETRYMETAMTAYSGYMDRLAQLNGVEMDQAARDRATASITKGFQAQMKLLSLLYPNATPIDWGVA